MITEWWTYTLSDFLMFAPHTYYRLLERYNVSVWPAQLAALGAAGAILAMLAQDRRRRATAIAVVLAAAWLWVGYAFHYARYAQINWGAAWLALAFAVEAVLLLALAPRLALTQDPHARRWSMVIVALATLGYPLMAPIAGRSLASAEMFAMTSDPTAIATIAIVAIGRGPVRALLLVIPVLMAAAGFLTLWAMDDAQAIVVALASAAALFPLRARRDDS